IVLGGASTIGGVGLGYKHGLSGAGAGLSAYLGWTPGYAVGACDADASGARTPPASAWYAGRLPRGRS
ncbi:hypothetical protein ACWGMW_26970, partial [Streptomyces albidoflavus]